MKPPVVYSSIPDSNNTGSLSVASEQTRQRLLEAAEQVFVERGFYDATIREICKRAGLNIAMVNYHFGDKLRLYIEVLRGSSVASKSDVLSHVHDPDADPVVLLRNLVTMFLRKVSRKDNVYALLMRQEALRPTPAMEFLIEETMRPAYVSMCALIGRILKLPAKHEKTRLATHSVIAQIKHFGEPERLLTQLDPTILSGKTPEDLANSIVNFSLAFLESREVTDRVAKKGTAKVRALKKPIARTRR